MAGTSQNSERGTLEKSLSPWQVGALALGCIVGWGCFVLPGISFLPNAGPLATIIAFAIGGIVMSVVALSYSHMIEHYPVAGGEFAYAYAGFGPMGAFACGWALVLGYLSIVGINASAIALLARFLLPGVFEFGYLYTIAGWDVYVGEVLIMTASILMFGIMNYRGVSVAGSIQLVLAFALTFGVIAMTFGVVTTDTFALSNLVPHFAEGKSPIASIITVVAIAPFLFVGFDTIPQAAEEFSFSPKKARVLMLGAIALGAILYTLVTFCVGSVIPYKELLGQDHAWATGAVAHLALGKYGSLILGTAVLGAVCTGMNGFYLATTRLIFSIARGKFLPQWFGEVHPKYHTPHNAIIFTMVISLLTPWAGRAVVGWIVDMCSVGTVIAYLFTCLVCYKMFAARGEKNITSILGAIASFIILGMLTIPGSPAIIGTEPWILMVIWIIMGVGFYMIQIQTVRNTPELEIRESIFGDNTIPVFFDTEEKTTAPRATEN